MPIASIGRLVGLARERRGVILPRPGPKYQMLLNGDSSAVARKTLAVSSWNIGKVVIGLRKIEMYTAATMGINKIRIASVA